MEQDANEIAEIALDHIAVTEISENLEKTFPFFWQSVSVNINGGKTVGFEGLNPSLEALHILEHALPKVLLPVRPGPPFDGTERNPQML